MNNYVLIWGDLLSCDPLRGSYDSQSPIVPHLVATLIYLSQNYSYYIRGDGSPLTPKKSDWLNIIIKNKLSITIIINQTITSGVFPDNSKIAKGKGWSTYGRKLLIQVHKKILNVPCTSNYIKILLRTIFSTIPKTELAAFELIDKVTSTMDRC